MEGNERAWCSRNMVSVSTMEMVVGMRTQVLGQLRASDFVRARGTGDIRDINTKTATTGAWSRRACWQVGIRVFGVGRLIYQWPCAGMYPNLVRQRSRTT